MFIRLVRGEHVVIGGDDGDIVTQHAFQRSETAEDPAAEVAKARDWVKARMAKAGMVEAA